ncbi:hypothetical protein [Salegentibacter chungangensis]|uniref:NIPSNAP domain-containing protein n=1 Tax=Salegentibacter chungangensis TaxID=1335724 RepID=A0ABW3NQ89_9FLAO
MRSLLLWVFLIPIVAISQNTDQESEVDNQEYVVFENVLLTPNPEHLKQFEEGLAAHNKQYHAEGPFGARVYFIASGPNSGRYIWSMGPLPWSAFDKRPHDKQGHDADWRDNVAAYILPESDQIYWRSHPDLSNFSQDFKIDKLLVDMYDVNRYKEADVIKSMEKATKVMQEKFPELTYGVYTNELPNSKDGRDLAMVFFFEEMAWMGKDPQFIKAYEEVNGEGSFQSFIREWGEITSGKQSEIWIYQPELSGLSAEVQTE